MWVTWGAVLGAALVDSVNPCALGVLTYIVFFLTSIKASRKKLMLLGGIYILMVFLTYLGIGFGLMAVIARLPWLEYVYLGLGALVIIAGLINIKDFFWYGKGFSLAIPQSAKPTIEKLTKKATIPATFLLGIFVALFEFPCTGAIYTTITSYLSHPDLRGQAVPYLIAYNLVFVAPLAVVLLLGAFGRSSDKVELFIEKNKRQMRLIMGLVMLALGVFVVYNSLNRL